MSMDWFKVTEWGSPMDWGLALGLATLTFLVLGMLRRGVRAHYRKMLATDHTEWLELRFGVLLVRAHAEPQLGDLAGGVLPDQRER